MKEMKKLVSILLAIAMTVMMATTVFAQYGKPTYAGAGTITIDKAVSGQTYRAYQILYLENYQEVEEVKDNNENVTNPGVHNYVYKVTDNWKGFFAKAGSEGENDPAENGPGLTYVNIDDQGYVTWKTGADVEEFAKAAQAWAKENKISATNTEEETTEGTETIKFEKLDLGYYLVDTTLGTLCSLDTTNPDVTMQEKNESPTNVKEVQEDSAEETEGNGWGSVNDADVGQTVNFESTITVKSGAENYTFHDKMDDGLTWNGTVTVKVNNTEVDSSKYTLTPATEGEGAPADKCTFEIKFDQEYIAGLEKDTQIVIEYSAIVNRNAVIEGGGNKNESHVEYGEEKNTTTTPPSTTKTYTWEFEIFKYTQDENGTKNALAGAEFALTPNEEYEENERLRFHVVTDGKAGEESTDGDKEDVYKLCTDTGCQDTETLKHKTTFTTNKSGLIKLQGLDSGTYYLHEITAPEGYNKLGDPIKVTIIKDKDGESVSIYKDYEEGKNNTAVTDGEIEILNQTGSELPSTGGIGTTIFYVLGAILFVGAGILLIVKKRMSAE